jgi:hypothetical protein
MKRKAYKYFTGETVWSFDGKTWFITDVEGSTTKPIKGPNFKKVALDMSNL